MVVLSIFVTFRIKFSCIKFHLSLTDVPYLYRNKNCFDIIYFGIGLVQYSYFDDTVR